MERVSERKNRIPDISIQKPAKRGSKRLQTHGKERYEQRTDELYHDHDPSATIPAIRGVSAKYGFVPDGEAGLHDAA